MKETILPENLSIINEKLPFHCLYLFCGFEAPETIHKLSLKRDTEYGCSIFAIFLPYRFVT
jgi:hypothetical protein